MTDRITNTLMVAALALALASPAMAQSRIKTMPGYDQWAEVSMPRCTASPSYAPVLHAKVRVQ